MATLASSNGVHNTEQTNAMSVTPFLRRLHVSIFARGKGSSYSGSALYDVWCDGLPTSPRIPACKYTLRLAGKTRQ